MHTKNEVGRNMATLVRNFCRVCSTSAARSIFSTGTSRYILKLDPNVPKSACSVLKMSWQSIRTSAAALKTVNITFIDRDNDKTTVQAKVGDTLLDVAKDNDIDLEGACEGTLACSTCHLVFDPDQYEKLKLESPSEEELDMLDLAYGLTDTSRLGCQIEVTEEMDGLVLRIPISVDARNA